MKDLFMLSINLKTVQIFVLSIFLSLPLKAQENNIWDSYCGDGSCFENISCESGQPLVVMMITSYGDHWNGNQLEIYNESGLLLNSFTKTVYGANYETAQFCLDDGCYTYTGIESGLWAEEISWVIYDTTGTSLVSEMGTFPSTGTFSVNSSCEIFVSDCTDSLAMNYNSMATVDDGSCEYNCEMYTMHLYDTWGDGWNGAYYTISNEWGVLYENQTLENGSEGTIEYCLQPDCYVLVSNVGGFNTECSIELIDSQGQTVLDTDLMYGTNSYVISVGNEDCQSIEPIYGCIDPLALNYDSEAEIDSGSCEYGCEFIQEVSNIGFNNMGGITWDLPEGIGTYYNSPVSYNITDSDGNILAGILAEMATNIQHFNILVDTSFWPSNLLMQMSYNINDSIYCSYPFDFEEIGQYYGCTDSLAINFNPTSVVTDWSCQYLNSTCTMVPLEVGGGQNMHEVSWVITDNESIIMTGGAPYSGEVCIDEGTCYVIQMYGGYATDWYGSTLSIGDSTYYPTGISYSMVYDLYSIDGTCSDVETCAFSSGTMYNCKSSKNLDISCLKLSYTLSICKL